MSLPDRFERVGVVVGSTLLLALPTNALWVAVFGIAAPSLAIIPWFLPGLVVGWLVATDRIPVTYRDVWAFSVVAYVLTFAAWAALGVESPSQQSPLAVGLWLAAVLVAAVGVRWWTRRGA